MTIQETQRANIEARRMVGSSAAPVSVHQNAMERYLSMSTFLTEPRMPGSGIDSNSGPTELRNSLAHETDKKYPESESGGALVAGIDGSRCAAHAARWAAEEAERRSGTLVLLHAYAIPPAGFSGYNPYPANVIPLLRADGLDLLRDCAAELRRDFPHLAVSTEQVYGDAVDALKHASKRAALTVVGAHGSNRVAVALGSVAAEIAAKNPVSVAVIHPQDPPAGGPVVVGIEESFDDGTLEYAFEAASLRRAPLTVVHCITAPAPSYLDVVGDLGSIDEPARQLLSERIGRWSGKYPDVAVHPIVLTDRPASALLDVAHTAALLVVGTRGHAGIGGILAGSVSHELIAYSNAPLVIVRSRSAKAAVS